MHVRIFRNTLPKKYMVDFYHFCLNAFKWVPLWPSFVFIWYYIYYSHFRITSHGGFFLTIDYGHDGSRLHPSLRAYKEHKLVDPLTSPGEVDITADVDFGYLRTALADKCLTFGPIEQKFVLV